MESIPLLRDIVILMAVSVPISMLLTRLGLPIIIGFLLTGVIIGPYGTGLVTELDRVETLAQIGVVLLLFTIGLEFSISRLLNIRKEGILGGGFQVGLTVLVVLGISLLLHQSFSVAMLLGFIISLSSTAIVLKLLVDRGEVNSPHGNLSVGVLIFQDLAVVLMVMVIQSIGVQGASALEIAKKLALSFAAFGVIVAGVLWLIPRIFDQVVKLRNREVFILTIVLVCLGTAWVTSLFGLSLALGAFIAGLAISESEYSNQIVAEVIPFRDTFSSLFFMSIGMLLDLSFFLGELPSIALLVAAIVALKALILVGVGRILRYPLRLSLIVGFNLAQIGEFSFILIKMGEDYSLFSHGLYQSLLAASIISMALTPFIYQRSSRLAYDVGKLLGRGGMRGGHRKTQLSNHVIIIGYGLNGRNLARVLKETGIPHLITDTNMERVKAAKAEGHSAFFGDASHPEVFKAMGVEKAKMVVTAISDPISTRIIVKNAREINQAVSILVRTRYIREVEELYRLGANQVIPEEFETSVEIFARVLRDYRVPSNIIQNQIDLIRQESYAMLRNPSMMGERLSRISSILEKTVMDTYYVEQDCAVAGKTIAELDMRKHSGATIIAIARGGHAKTNPVGSHAQLNEAFKRLKESCPVSYTHE